MNVFFLIAIYSLFVCILHANLGVVERKPFQNVTVNVHSVSITSKLQLKLIGFFFDVQGCLYFS